MRILGGAARLVFLPGSFVSWGAGLILLQLRFLTRIS